MSRAPLDLGAPGLNHKPDVTPARERFVGGILDAVVNPHALSLPPHTSFGIVEGFSLSLAKQALDGHLDDAIQTVEERVRLT
jgi:hypothetical protein